MKQSMTANYLLSLLIILFSISLILGVLALEYWKLPKECAIIRICEQEAHVIKKESFLTSLKNNREPLFIVLMENGEKNVYTADELTNLIKQQKKSDAKKADFVSRQKFLWENESAGYK